VTKKVLLVLAAGAMVLAACGGDDGGSADATTTTTAAAGPSKAELTAKVLTPDDLATGDSLDVGWSAGDVSDGVDIGLPECVDQDHFDTARTAVAKLVTNSPLKLPALEEHLTAYADAGALDAAMNAAADRLDACTPEFDFEGTKSSGTIDRLELPSMGDGVEAWRTTVEIAGTQVAITNAYVQKGDLIAAFVHVDGGTPDTATIAALLQKGIDKLG
jgi:hypothetical protein